MNWREQAREFLGGREFSFREVDTLWRAAKKGGDLSLARRVLERIRSGVGVHDGATAYGWEKRDEHARQEALLTSKDPELGSAVRHDRAMKILRERFALDDREVVTDAETLGIAGGILKRRWNDLGKLEDLKSAAAFYERGAEGPLGDDAYAAINAAFLDDLLAWCGDEPEERRDRARRLRERVVRDLAPIEESWFNAASRAEALFGLRRYDEAAQAILASKARPASWERRTTAEQLASMAYMQEERPHEDEGVRSFFETLLPGPAHAVRSVMLGKAGLSLSGGGLRAALYHLGVLARLADLDFLRHVEVLSCVSGGSIAGACYWLALREELKRKENLGRDDYVRIVRELIAHFEGAVERDLRHQVQPRRWAIVSRLLLHKERGLLDPEEVARVLEADYLRPLVKEGELDMGDLPFQPAGHDPVLTGEDRFHPTRHNWLRSSKVPVLVVNATTVNTGHAWQFTPTWMGESPWAIHESADSVPRLEWAEYSKEAGWTMSLARAVAASAAVPFLFRPIEIEGAYDGLTVQLVDGGVHDNQGVASLLAHDCTVVLVSDAARQLVLERKATRTLSGLGAYALRTMDTLMERVRWSTLADLDARKRSGLLRKLLVQHLKQGLDAGAMQPRFSQETVTDEWTALTPAGVRRDFQAALAELRTDLDIFSATERRALMACGYQMTRHSVATQLDELGEPWREPEAPSEWVFEEMLAEITSTEPATASRERLLAELREGSRRRP